MACISLSPNPFVWCFVRIVCFVCMWCAHMSMRPCVLCTRLLRPEKDDGYLLYHPSSCFFETKSSQNWKFPFLLARLAAQRDQFYPPVLGLQEHNLIWLFTWMPRIQIQSFMLAQILLGSGPSLQNDFTFSFPFFLKWKGVWWRWSLIGLSYRVWNT